MSNSWISFASLIALVVMVTGCATNVESVRRAVVNRFSEPEAPIVRVITSPVAGCPGLYVSLYDWITEWWGSFACFEFKDGAIQWTAICSQPPREQRILAVRGFQLRGFSSPVVEVLGQTHMGNGDLYLYLLEDKQLRLVLETRAVDRCNQEDWVFRGGMLTISYPDFNKDGVAEVMLEGVRDRLAENEFIGSTPIESHPCRRVFVWHPAFGVFVEDVLRRRGLDPE